MTVISVKNNETKPDIKEFSLGGPLGEGNFSTVCVATHKATKEKFALKSMEKQKINRIKIRHPNIFNEIQMEKAILNRLRHPNIIRLYHTFQDKNNLYYLMEMVSGGELWDYIVKDSKQIGCDESIARFFLVDIINGMEYMHSEGVVHRDLKPENMLLSKENGHLKIVDFGTAKDLKDSKLNGPNFVGTPEYMSPETIDNKSVNIASDLWALGCIAYQLVTGETPFNGGSSYLTFLRTRELEYRLPDFLSDNAKDLISRLLVLNPDNRIGYEKDGYSGLKGHPFFHGVDFDTHSNYKIPIPSLQNICINSIFQYIKKENGESSGIGNGQLNMPIHSLYPPHISVKNRSHVMHLLNRMELLHKPNVYKNFFKDPNEFRYHYSTPVGYLGMTHASQRVWKEEFSFVIIANPEFGKEEVLRVGNDLTQSQCEVEIELMSSIIKNINQLNPKFVIILGNVTYSRPDENMYKSQLSAFKNTMNLLNSSIQMIFVCGNNFDSHGINLFKQEFGEDHFSFWCNGNKAIVLNTNLMAQSEKMKNEYIAQENWFQKELENGKLCSHQQFVFGSHSFFENDKAVTEETRPLVNSKLNSECLELSKEMKSKYINMMKAANVRGVFTIGPNDAFTSKKFYCNEQQSRNQSDGDESNDDDDKKIMEVLSTNSCIQRDSKSAGLQIVNVSQYDFKQKYITIENFQ